MPATSTFAAVMNLQSVRFTAPSIEPLENRIAPATIFVGNPNVDDTEYADGPFINTETSSDALALQVGKGVEGVNDTFILRLSGGDQVILFAPGGDAVFLDLNGGTAAAFFVDHNLDGEVQATELTGLSLGKGANMTVKGTVYGDVVSNLTDSGNLDITAGVHGLVSVTQGISKFAANDVIGSVISGGKISNLSAGAVGSILTGTAANGVAYDFFRPDPGDPAAPDVPGGGGTLTVIAGAGIAGPSIQGVQLKSIADRMVAGDGGASAKGGVISGVEITADSDGFLIAAGDGGIAGAKPIGGAGGSVTNVFISGFADATPNSLISTQIIAGDGGDATATGKGGAGGTVSKLYVGFDKRGNKPVESSDVIQDSLLIRAGDGGDGKTAGKGGAITSTKARISTLFVDDPMVPGDEFVMNVQAGHGGATFAGGKSGAGGGLSNVDFRNLSPVISGSIVSVSGGNGGVGPAELTGTGAVGGAISKLVVLGEGFVVNGGDGSSGLVGGRGGAVTNVNTFQSETVIPRVVAINGGTGGNGGAGNAGAGGAINGVKIESADFTDFKINDAASASGNGGSSTGGKGGGGGPVTKVNVLEVSIVTPVEGVVAIRSGDGGNGATGGGAGGAISKFVYAGDKTDLTASSGTGGSVIDGGNGKGGAGGAINNVLLSSSGSITGVPVIGTIAAGNGGAGKGAGAGGVGGAIKTASLNVDGDLLVSSGNGGSGVTGASGSGGSISKTGAFSEFGSGALQAGNAGATGGKPGNGGSILSGSNLRANIDISLIAGDGQAGGSGGTISSVNFSSSSSSLLPAPSGTITVQAGDGSGSATTSGKGGSLTNVIGYASSGLGEVSTFAAGVGGGGTRASAGGSIQNLQIIGGGADGGIVTIAAGDAGDATALATGAKGGDVRAVEVAGLADGTILRSVAAGDGGNGTSRGGSGGSVQQVFVLGTDIGDRFGGNFGYDTMGGIFAGLGGSGGPGGQNGSVIDVRAESIAAIVAGRVGTPGLVERIDRVIIGTSNIPVNLLKVEELDFSVDGGDANFGTVDAAAYATNNLIGFYADPTRTDTNRFAFTDGNANGLFDLGEVPTDGLIMAKAINLKTFNSTPEAYLTSTTFFDYNNRIS